MSSEWSSEIWLAEAVLNSVHINSLVPVNGRQDDGWHGLHYVCESTCLMIASQNGHTRTVLMVLTLICKRMMNALF